MHTLYIHVHVYMYIPPLCVCVCVCVCVSDSKEEVDVRSSLLETNGIPVTAAELAKHDSFFKRDSYAGFEVTVLHLFACMYTHTYMYMYMY